MVEPEPDTQDGQSDPVRSTDEPKSSSAPADPAVSPSERSNTPEVKTSQVGMNLVKQLLKCYSIYLFSELQ